MQVPDAAALAPAAPAATTATTAITSTPEVINGIDVESLRRTIAAVTAEPSSGMTGWRIRSRWMGGTRSDHHVDGYVIGGRRVERSFVIRTDEPHELCGSDRFPNPQEHLQAALNACMMVGYAAVASLMGITLTRLEVETSGEIDLRGFLGISDEVGPGYPGLRQTVHLAADCDPAELERLHAIVQRTSPNFNNLSRAVPVRSTLVIAHGDA